MQEKKSMAGSTVIAAIGARTAKMGLFISRESNNRIHQLIIRKEKKNKELVDVFQEHDETETGRIRWNPSINSSKKVKKGKPKREQFPQRETESKRQRRERVTTPPP